LQQLRQTEAEKRNERRESAENAVATLLSFSPAEPSSMATTTAINKVKGAKSTISECATDTTNPSESAAALLAYLKPPSDSRTSRADQGPGHC
jgi:hypothetical protein